MKTYLTVWFHSEGARPFEVTKKLEEVGFSPVKGNHDYVYKWGNDATVDEVLSIGDDIQDKLKGDKILFELETV